MSNNTKIAQTILKWYDKNARALPWRVPPKDLKRGLKPNPYHVWLSEIMLQQTQVTVAKSYFEFFLLKWPTIRNLATAKDEEIMGAWAGLGYYRRARNLIKCAKIIVEDYDATFPQDEKVLLSLPGVGSYTAAAIQSIAFDKKATVIDGNINRIISRLFAIALPITLSHKKIKLYAELITPMRRFGDYAQALMDLGSEICTPKNPKCSSCPLKKTCQSFRKGLSNLIPSPIEKKIKPIKYGYAFVTLTDDNSIILETRPDEGLLGGMLCFPSSQWTETKNLAFTPPFDSNWHILNEPVEHIFSHFRLKLVIAIGNIKTSPLGYVKKPLKTFDRKSLPTLMRKIYDVGITPSS